jgi:hypothetical protein
MSRLDERRRRPALITSGIDEPDEDRDDTLRCVECGEIWACEFEWDSF